MTFDGYSPVIALFDFSVMLCGLIIGVAGVLGWLTYRGRRK